MSRIHRKLYKKGLNDWGNHYDIVTHLDPGILECEVKSALGSININKVVEMMEFELSYFKS